MKRWYAGTLTLSVALAFSALMLERHSDVAAASTPTDSSQMAGNVTKARVLAEAGRGDNWLVNGGNFESQHFSPLKSITDQNIGRLGLAWAIPIDSHMGLSMEPIVVDGVIYIGTPFDVVYAIDGVTGKVRWQFDPHIRINGPWRNSYEGRKNRGVAVWNGKVYVGTGDCRVVAIDAATGKKVWDTPVCDADQTGNFRRGPLEIKTMAGAAPLLIDVLAVARRRGRKDKPVQPRRLIAIHIQDTRGRIDSRAAPLAAPVRAWQDD